VKRFLALALGTGLAAALLVAGVLLLNIDERRRWQIQRQIFGPEPVGIFQADERLGWRHLPGAEGGQREVPDFDVRYRIDAFGNRLTPGAPPPGAPALIFLGGSFTFGHGVEDGETYPALLQQRWPELRIVNAATNGWGTSQALLALEELLAREPKVAGVVYAFISNHVVRNHLRKEWLVAVDEMQGRRNTHFELVGEDLVFQGLAGPELGVEASPEQVRREKRITVALVRALSRRCDEAGVPFLTVYLPDGTRGPIAPLLAKAVGPERLVDLRPELRYGSLHFAHDSHLRPEGHRQLAAALASTLSERMRLKLGSERGFE
jgi:hypothetical protein